QKDPLDDVQGNENVVRSSVPGTQLESEDVDMLEELNSSSSNEQDDCQDQKIQDLHQENLDEQNIRCSSERYTNPVIESRHLDQQENIVEESNSVPLTITNHQYLHDALPIIQKDPLDDVQGNENVVRSSVPGTQLESEDVD